MTYYKTWLVELPLGDVVCTDAPEDIRVVAAEYYDRLREAFVDSYDKCNQMRDALEKIEVHPNAGFNVAAMPEGEPTIADIAHKVLEENR